MCFGGTGRGIGGEHKGAKARLLYNLVLWTNQNCSVFVHRAGGCSDYLKPILNLQAEAKILLVE